MIYSQNWIVHHSTIKTTNFSYVKVIGNNKSELETIICVGLNVKHLEFGQHYELK